MIDTVTDAELEAMIYRAKRKLLEAEAVKRQELGEAIRKALAEKQQRGDE